MKTVKVKMRLRAAIWGASCTLLLMFLQTMVEADAMAADEIVDQISGQLAGGKPTIAVLAMAGDGNHIASLLAVANVQAGAEGRFSVAIRRSDGEAAANRAGRRFLGWAVSVDDDSTYCVRVEVGGGGQVLRSPCEVGFIVREWEGRAVVGTVNWEVAARANAGSRSSQPAGASGVAASPHSGQPSGPAAPNVTATSNIAPPTALPAVPVGGGLAAPPPPLATSIPPAPSVATATPQATSTNPPTNTPRPTNTTPPLPTGTPTQPPVAIMDGGVAAVATVELVPTAVGLVAATATPEAVASSGNSDNGGMAGCIIPVLVILLIGAASFGFLQWRGKLKRHRAAGQAVGGYVPAAYPVGAGTALMPSNLGQAPARPADADEADEDVSDWEDEDEDSNR